jgi:hypothetical protein
MSKVVLLPLRVHRNVFTLSRDTVLDVAITLALPDRFADGQFEPYAGKDSRPLLDVDFLLEELDLVAMTLDRSFAQAAMAEVHAPSDADVQL